MTKLNIEQELRMTLYKIEDDLRLYKLSGDMKSTLYIAKIEALKALQKYE